MSGPSNPFAGASAEFEREYENSLPPQLRALRREMRGLIRKAIEEERKFWRGLLAELVVDIERHRDAAIGESAKVVRADVQSDVHNAMDEMRQYGQRQAEHVELLGRSLKLFDSMTARRLETIERSLGIKMKTVDLDPEPVGTDITKFQ